MNIVARNPMLALADRWQRGFPLRPRPFEEIAAGCGLTEREVIYMFRDLIDAGALCRVGAVVRPNTAGASTLAAIAAPAERLEEIAAIVSSEPCVNHNYEREHAFNMWFVVAAPDEASLTETLQRIEQRTACPVLDLRLEQPYHIDLGFPLGRSGIKQISNGIASRLPTDFERRLLALMEDGITLISRPYEELACRIGATEDDVIDAIAGMIDAGIIQRFGCVLVHRKLGYKANAMAVWDIADEDVDRVGATVAGMPDVTLCYRRNRVLPHWPFNLFAMVHGIERSQVRDCLGEIIHEAGMAGAPHAVLFSTRCFKQRGARFSPAGQGCSA